MNENLSYDINCAISNDDIDELISIITENDCLEMPSNNDRQTPLMLAVKNANIEMVAKLIEIGANVNAKDLLDKTPLMMIGFDSIKIAKLLIDSGADINALDSDQKTPLIWSAYDGNPKVSQYLIDLSVDIETIETFSGNTALTAAVKYRHDETMRVLLSAGASTTTKNRQQLDALLLAIEQKSHDRLKTLLSYTKNIDAIIQLYEKDRPEHAEYLKCFLDQQNLENTFANASENHNQLIF